MAATHVPGDTVHIEAQVTAITPSRSRPDRGIVTIRSETKNQDGAIVQVLQAKVVVPRRTQAQSQPPEAGG